MAELPKKLVVNIILLLPIKSVLRCQLLSKSFKKIISSSYFINLYSENITNQDYIMILQNRQTRSYNSPTDNQTPLRKIYLSYHDEAFATINREIDCPIQTHSPIPNWLDIVGCSRGLVCLTDPFSIYLWNPTIKKSKVIPIPEVEKFLYGSVFGFGFSQRSRDFKVVRLVLEETGFTGKASYRVEIYTLGLNSWKRVENISKGRIGGPFATVKGVVHWLASENSMYYILGFDMDEEVFHKITLPKPEQIRFVFNNNDTLCVTYPCGDSDYDIWAMKEYGKADSWTKLPKFKNNEKVFSLPLSIMKNGVFVNWKIGRGLALYDTRIGRFTKDLEVLKHVDVQENYDSLPSIFTYRESLYLLNEQEVTKVVGD